MLTICIVCSLIVKSLTSLDLSSFNTPNLKNMEQMFSDCGSLSSLDLSNFDTTIVEDISNALFGISNNGKIIYNSKKFTSNIINLLPKGWEKLILVIKVMIKEKKMTTKRMSQKQVQII